MILRDPVHGLISFETEETELAKALLETREVQRLRRIRQLGLTSWAFPGAEHTRFSHALGAAHVMQLLIARLRQIEGDLPFWQRLTSDRAVDSITAALLHDVGHGPFSHLFEDAIPGAPRHEVWTTRIILDPDSEVHQVLARRDPGLPGRVAGLVQGHHDLPYLEGAVSGTFDVDRCDYLLRDAWATGVGYGEFDLPWLLRSLRFGDNDVEGRGPLLAVDGLKGIMAIESFLLARLFMFQQVYFHKTTRAGEMMVRSILRRALHLMADGVRLAVSIPGMVEIANGGTPTLSSYLGMDDQELLVAMRAYGGDRDPILSDLSRRLDRRALFKTLELGGVESSRSPEEALLVARDIASSNGLNPDYYVHLDRATDTPFSEKSAPKVIFPDGRSRDLWDVSFLLGRLKGERLSRTRLVFAAELRTAIREALST